MARASVTSIFCLLAFALSVGCSKKSDSAPAPAPEVVTAADLAGEPGIFSGVTTGTCQVFDQGAKIADCTTTVRIQQNGKFIDGSITMASDASIQFLMIPTLEIFGNGLVYQGDLIGKIGARALTFTVTEGETISLKLIDLDTVAYTIERTKPTSRKVTGMSSRRGTATPGITTTPTFPVGTKP